MELSSVHLHQIQRLKKEMIAVGKRSVDLGYVTTVGGNICYRLSESMFLITVSGIPLDELTPERILLIDKDGNPLDSSEAKPSKETPMHLSILKARSDVNAVLHLHPLVSTTLASIDEPITPVTSEELFFLGDKVGIVPFLPAGSSALHEAVLREALSCNIIILKNHGCVALGKDLREAFYRVVKLERAAQATVVARVFGKKIAPFTS